MFFCHIWAWSDHPFVDQILSISLNASNLLPKSESQPWHCFQLICLFGILYLSTNIKHNRESCFCLAIFCVLIRSACSYENLGQGCPRQWTTQRCRSSSRALRDTWTGMKDTRTGAKDTRRYSTQQIQGNQNPQKVRFSTHWDTGQVQRIQRHQNR